MWSFGAYICVSSTLSGKNETAAQKRLEHEMRARRRIEMYNPISYRYSMTSVQNSIICSSHHLGMASLQDRDTYIFPHWLFHAFRIEAMQRRMAV